MNPPIVVPALTFRDSDGRIDVDATRCYIEHAVRTWVPTFIISGSTVGGHRFSVAQRAALLDLWLERAAPSRLVTGCWHPADLSEAVQRAVTPLVPMQGLADESQALAYFEDLPSSAYVYSHPRYSTHVFDPALARSAQHAGSLPAGAKVSKTPLDQLAAIRAAAGPDFVLWDGSSRHVTASVEAGASAVVATPLSPLPQPFPPPRAPLLQDAINDVQVQLDGLSSRDARTALLVQLAQGWLGVDIDQDLRGAHRSGRTCNRR